MGRSFVPIIVSILVAWLYQKLTNFCIESQGKDTHSEN